MKEAGSTPAKAFHATTVLAVLRDGAIAMAGDGQVTLGSAAVKHGAQKVRRSASGRALIGFAGGAADGMALLERLEAKTRDPYGPVDVARPSAV